MMTEKLSKILVCALALALALAPLSASADRLRQNGNVWDGSIAGSFAGGSGTEADPFLISDGSELALLAETVNGGDECEGFYFALATDIVLNDTADFENWSENYRPENFWHPIGGSAYSFRGSFDGRGHTVAGMFACATNGTKLGLFGSAENTVIRDLSVIRSCVLGNSDAVGGIIGAAEGVYIIGCGFEGTVCGTRSVGGICGSAGCCYITDCSTQVNISAFQYAGGIVGIAGVTALSGCEASGTIDANDRAGGMIGYALVGCSAVNCLNGAAIDCGEYAGGIAGLGHNTEVSYCENLADITAERYTGGIFGLCCGSSADHCANRGDISGEYYIGGMIGWADDGADFGQTGAYDTVNCCSNSGRVCGEWGVGGIAGDAHFLMVTDSFNTGLITAEQYAGGLIGYAKDTSAARCYSVGIVRAEHAGALFGRNTAENVTAENVYYLDRACAGGDAFGTGERDGLFCSDEGYEGFDFGGVWFIDPETYYPYAQIIGMPDGPALPESSGDINGDGIATVSDAVAALRAAMGIMALSPEEILRGDTDLDGRITVADAVAALRAAMGNA